MGEGGNWPLNVFVEVLECSVEVWLHLYFGCVVLLWSHTN